MVQFLQMGSTPIRPTLPEDEMKRRARNVRSGPKSRKQAHWALMVGSALAASTAAQPASASTAADGLAQSAARGASETRTVQLNIPAGPLDAAIAEFERVTGVKVIMGNPAIGNVQSPGASGILTTASALDALLKGTNVRATFKPDGVHLDLPSVSEFVAVQGQTPKAD